MSEEKKITAKEFFEGFPEAPVSDTFKWYDTDGYEHMLTIRGYAVSAVLKAVEETRAALKEQGGLSAKVLPKAQTDIPMRDENGTPVVDADHKPIMAALPEGVHMYTVAGLAHDKTKTGKDVLKVWTVEEPYNKGYGVSCFHPPQAVGNWKAWQLTSKENKNKYAPPTGMETVLIRDPKQEGGYPDVVEFRAGVPPF